MITKADCSYQRYARCGGVSNRSLST